MQARDYRLPYISTYPYTDQLQMGRPEIDMLKNMKLPSIAFFKAKSPSEVPTKPLISTQIHQRPRVASKTHVPQQPLRPEHVRFAFSPINTTRHHGRD
jgi:hypothetical protein